ncbi:MAG TPA: sigma factor-like helix-turn-helix DNA-binding protein [Streptomyces sp.]|uniref:sigma factor-like helix-turn-helix DNA-binding protein n=1 Tax=Streptomyces sp. TaxID=1931 RepID=UPI002D091C5A|nr:sigma factor-like helix-turn-helix DNA-binding protein [Streptomyces sp.]HWU06323.1 sigma factor-like helix-turn-helix DNA-binding protein [Streptomyces sp.]
MTRHTTGPAPAVPLPSPKERRRLREARALSVEEAAKAVGVTAATVRSWETGRTSPRGRRRAAYARLIGCAEGRPLPSPPVEATTPAPETPARAALAPGTPGPDALSPGTSTPGAPVPDAPAPAGSAPAGSAPETTAPRATAPEDLGRAPQSKEGLTAEEAFDALYHCAAPGLTRQVYLLTGRRKLSQEAVEHAFRTAWQRWPEVAQDRDPAGWARAVSYEYAMSPWRRLRRVHRRADPLPEDPARGALLDALLGLPPSYRRTLLLHDGVGLGLPETAAETEASTPAAASRLVNARTAVAERLPEPTAPQGAGDRSAPPLRERLRALALAAEVPAPSPAPAVRAGSERVAGLWTRSALCFGALLISATAFTLYTAPTQYEQPLAPARPVGDVPPPAGPQKLTPQDLKLQKSLRNELTHGPERLVPRIP